jgi:hypothetical protein
MRRIVATALIALPAALPLAAQSPRGPAAITEAGVRRRMNLIAADSMQGRDTPSRGLDLTATYVDREFKRMGLTPLGEKGSSISGYRIFTRHIDGAGSSVTLSGPGGSSGALTFASAAQFAFGTPPVGIRTLPVAVLGGTLKETDALDPALTRGKAILFVGDWSKGMPRGVTLSAAAALTGQAEMVLMPMNAPAGPLFGLSAGDAALNPVSKEGANWFLASAQDLALTAQWASLTQRLTALRTNPAMVAEPLEGWTITTDIKASDTDQQTVPNAAAMVRGSDPKLRDEYVVISAHMDHVGHRCNGVTPADSVCNGADDDASGTVGVLELAKAFATAPTRPKRSVIFLIVSGEERGLWGSDAWAAKPPVPIGQIVANLNMDMVGRNWKDTVVAIGQEYSDLGRSLTQVTARHPELRMTAIGDQWPAEGTYYRSDHFHFARRGVPILFFTSGFHPDYHGVTDSPEKIDAEKEARLLKVLYYLARDVADRTARPQWEPESYRRIVEPAYQH